MRFNFSFEAVNFQKTDNAFQALTDLFRRVREKHPTKVTGGDIMRAGFNEIMAKYFGFNKVKMTVSQQDGPNAAVLPPLFTQESIMYQKMASWLRGYPLVKRKRSELFEALKSNPVAWVDREKGKVGGAFSEVLTEFYVTRGLVLSKKFTPEEIAAIQLHEIGHAFSYLETSARLFATNLAIETNIEELIGAKTDVERFKIVERLKDKEYLSWYQNVERVAKLDNESLTAIVISDNYIDHKYIKGQAPLYTSTMFEQQADQFATRMGAGEHIVSGLSKIYEYCKPYDRFATFQDYLVFSARIVTVGLLAIKGAFGMILLMSSFWLILDYLTDGYQEIHRTYDKRWDRFKRIRNEMVGRLKMFGKDTDFADRMLEQLDSVEENMNKVSNDTGLFAWGFKIYANIFYSADSARKREQVIEDLINNELYVQYFKWNKLGRK